MRRRIVLLVAALTLPAVLLALPAQADPGGAERDHDRRGDGLVEP
jgi:hypothetical protein